MYRIILSSILTFLLCISLQAETLIGKVVRIADGDTFTLLVDKNSIVSDFMVLMHLRQKEDSHTHKDLKSTCLP